MDNKKLEGEINKVVYDDTRLKAKEADRKFDVGGDMGLIQGGKDAGREIMIH